MPNPLLAALGVVCSACDHHNPPGSARCAGCNAPLNDAPVPSPSKPATPADISSAARALAEPLPARAPPGMRPVARPVGETPIPATELVRRPPSGPAPVASPRLGLTAVEGAARGQTFRLPAGACAVGRSKGAILFPDDGTVSAHHATLFIRDGQLFVRDESSISGVYVTVNGQETLPAGALFAAGPRLFRYLGALPPPPPPQPKAPAIYGAPLASGATLYGAEEILVGGRPGRAVATAGPLITVGQDRCDFNYPREEGLAAKHCELVPSATLASLKDLSGGMGTFVRIPSGQDRPLKVGDRIRVGAQVLQVQSG